MPNTPAQKQAWDKASRSRDRKLQMELVKSEMHGAGWKTERFLHGLENSDDLYFQAVRQIRLAKWHKNRVICVGDTAYAPTPFTGMGTSLAINAAFLLAGHLSQLEPNQHPSTPFESYEAEFRRFVQKIQEIPWFVPGIAPAQHAWSRWLFHQLVSVAAYVNRIPWVVRTFGPKPSSFGEGLVDQLDAPFPRFAAFEQARATTA